MSAEGQPDITMCDPDCPARLLAEPDPTLTARMIHICELAASVLVYRQTELKDCPLIQYAERVFE